MEARLRLRVVIGSWMLKAVYFNQRKVIFIFPYDMTTSDTAAVWLEPLYHFIRWWQVTIIGCMYCLVRRSANIAFLQNAIWYSNIKRYVSRVPLNYSAMSFNMASSCHLVQSWRSIHMSSAVDGFILNDSLSWTMFCRPTYHSIVMSICHSASIYRLISGVSLCQRTRFFECCPVWYSHATEHDCPTLGWYKVRTSSRFGAKVRPTTSGPNVFHGRVDTLITHLLQRNKLPYQLW